MYSHMFRAFDSWQFEGSNRKEMCAEKFRNPGEARACMDQVVQELGSPAGGAAIGVGGEPTFDL
jgi:hypothetical protein